MESLDHLFLGAAVGTALFAAFLSRLEPSTMTRLLMGS